MLICRPVLPAFAQNNDEEINAVVSAAEATFTKLKEREYQAVWALLTEKSRQTIASDTYKSVAKSDNRFSREQIEADFSSGGPLSVAYWQGYLHTFDPNDALKQSTWQMGMLKKDRAEIRLLYRKSDAPALLKMFKENGAWKFGLVETFWSRK